MHSTVPMRFVKSLDISPLNYAKCIQSGIAWDRLFAGDDAHFKYICGSSKPLIPSSSQKKKKKIILAWTATVL